MARSCILAVAFVAGLGHAQPGRPGMATLFPSEHAQGIRWYSSLAEGIQAAGKSGKPICLIIAGRRPSGDC